MLNLFLDLDDYFFGQGGACQLRNSSGVLGKPTPPLWTQGMSQGLASPTPENCQNLGHIQSYRLVVIILKRPH